MKKVLFSICLTVIGLCFSAAANAATTTQTLAVSLTVSPVVIVSTNPLDFGTALAGAAATGSTTITVNCTTGTVATIDLDNGVNGARNLTDGANLVSYNLYKEVAYTNVWGTGMAGGTTVAAIADGTNQVYTMYGQCANTGAVTGNFTDTITVTVNY